MEKKRLVKPQTAEAAANSAVYACEMAIFAADKDKDKKDKDYKWPNTFLCGTRCSENIHFCGTFCS